MVPDPTGKTGPINIKIHFLQILLLGIIILLPSTSVLGFNGSTMSRSARAEANALPVPFLNVSTQELMTLETIIVDASNSYDPDGIVTGYFFQFEDGTETGWVTTPVVEHIYLKERFYNIRLKVIDDRGLESSYWTKITVNVHDRLPFIIIESEMTVKPNEPVLFEGYRCWDEDGYIINYTWEFEDNTTLYGPNVTHVFKKPGIYNIFLTILDDDRKTNKSSVRVVVLEDNEIPRRQVLRGIAIVLTTAVLGVSAILFSRRTEPGLGRSRRAALTAGQRKISLDAELIKTEIESWKSMTGTNIFDKVKVMLPPYSEQFIFDFAGYELYKEHIKISSKTIEFIEEVGLAMKLKNPLSRRGAEVLGLTLSDGLYMHGSTVTNNDVIKNGSGGLSKNDVKTVKNSINVYTYTLKGIGSSDQLGGARYYVPRTSEQESIAAFISHKVRIRQRAKKRTDVPNLSKDDELFIDEIIDLLGRCWTKAHSFKARAHSPEVKLLLTLAFCEKVGKRRFGHGDPVKFDAIIEDQELDLIDELMEMFNEVWSILQMHDYKDMSQEEKIMCALYVYEILGAHRYLGSLTPLPKEERAVERDGVGAI